MVHHFSRMIKQKTHRHDQPYDAEIFNKDMDHLCGMLYSVISLKAFFPKSPAKIQTGDEGAKEAGDKE
jgi:hypothetical protein